MVPTSEVEIRAMRADELQAAIAAIRDGGWGDRTRELTFYAGHPEMTVLVAEGGGEIVGTTVVKASAGVGWVGLVFVAPSQRGRGLGTELTRAGLARLEADGCRTVLLAASDMGERIYERLGFVTEGAYAVLRGPGLGAEVPATVRAIADGDFDAVCELDRAATGEDRARVFSALGPRGWIGDGGFAVRSPWGRGPSGA